MSDESGRVINQIDDGKCPVCGRTCNLIFRVIGQMRSPDKGDWCYQDGAFYVHEELVWRNDDGA